MATGTILSVTDDGYFHQIKVRVVEGQDSITDYTVEVASAVLAAINDNQKREFIRLTVKAQRDKRIATHPPETPVPITGDLTI